MILTKFHRSISLLSVPYRSFGLLFMDKKYTQATFDSLIKDIESEDLHNNIS